MELLGDIYNYVFHLIAALHGVHIYHWWQKRKIKNDIQVIKADIQAMKKKLDAI